VGDNRAPTSPGMIPREQPTGPAGGAPSPTPGYSEPRPLSPPPGIRWVDAQLDAQDAKDRAELARKLGALGKR